MWRKLSQSSNFFKLTLIFIFLNCGNMQAEKDTIIFHVSPNGSDNNPGTKNKPFQTIVKARDAARNVESGKQKKIIMQGGLYYETHVELKSGDNGLTIEAAPGETPVLYGGRPVTEWKKEGDFFIAELEGVKEGIWDFRALVVNDEMRPRARLPETGAFTHLSEFDVRWMSSTGGGWERKPTPEELTTMKYKKGDIGPWLDINNAELTIFHAWDESVVGLESIDNDTQTLTFSIPSGHPPGAFGNWMEKARTYVVWNIREGMHHPGQWYLNRTEGKLVYWPLPGEDISEIRAVIPTTETIISLEDETKNITIKGLTLSCMTTPLITGGFGALRFDGAISGNELDTCHFINLTVQNVGGWGIKAYGDNIIIEGCEIKDSGAGGIAFGGKNVSVANNHIHDIGVIYPSALALRGGGEDSRISHNEIHNTPYSAINCGGTRMVIENNLIYDMMQVLNDGGAIYCFGPRDLIMRGNIVRGSSGTRAHAYYLDERAENCSVEKNLAVDTTWPVHNHMTKNCFIRNNVFIDSGSQFLTFPRTSGMTFEKNILIAEEITFRMPTGTAKVSTPPENVPESVKPFLNADGITAMQNNIIFSRTGTITHEVISDYSTVETFPLDPRDGTIFAAPEFVDSENGDYNFKPGSPAHKLGIEPIDVSTAGRISSEQ